MSMIPVGNRSVPSPRSQPVTLEAVSNGCGGSYGSGDRLLDEVSFPSGTKGLKFKVRFRVACSIHDAGYGGYKVRDPLQANKVVDFAKWTRKQVDDKFLIDLRRLCVQQLPRDKLAAAALRSCYTKADAYYAVVRRVGVVFWDADLFKPGDQLTGPRK